MPLIIPANSITGGYEVANSLRFDDGSSDYLNRTPSNAGNRKTWTWSGWIKRGNISTSSRIVSTDLSSNTFLGFNSDNTIRFIWISGLYENFTSAVYRDVSAWYHIVVAVDTTQATASDRLKLYVNGVLQTWGTYNPPLQNAESGFNNSSVPHYISSYNGTNEFFDGYMSEVCLIDGQALDPTSFGEFDEDSGIWKPKAISGLTFGTNGFYLDFENSGSLGADVSGNGNNFTLNNLTSIDQTTDTPTNNYCTLNPLHFGTTIPSSYSSLSEGNTKFVSTQGGSPYPYYFSTMAISQGKWYAEFKRVQGTAMIGVGSTPDGFFGNNSTDAGYYTPDGNLYSSGSGSGYGDAFNDNDILGVALDLDNNAVYFSRNGVWQNSGVPTSGASKTGAVSLTDPSSLPSGVYHFVVGDSGGSTATVESNFGNPPFTISSGNSDANGFGNFEYAVPSGYYALNTKNLSEFG